MKPLSAPRARSRSRLGMKPLNWQDAPTADDMWPDKVEVDLRGRVQWPDGVSFVAYLRTIFEHVALPTKPSVGRKYRSPISYGSIVGKVTIEMTSDSRADDLKAGSAIVRLSLFLNPTRTRALTVRRNKAPLDEMSLSEFFRKTPAVRDAYREDEDPNEDRDALDGNDNFFWNAEEAGGTTSQERSQCRDTYLQLFERRLREVVKAVLTPHPVPPPDSPNLCAEERTAVDVFIDWEGLKVRSAEVYVERFDVDAVRVATRLQDRAKTLARIIQANRYPSRPARFGEEIGNSFAHFVIPLTGTMNIELSIYAKTPRRLRIEVRYRTAFSHILRKVPADNHKLASALGCLMVDGAKRIPWKALRSANSFPPHGDVVDVLDLLESMTSAVQNQPHLRSPILRKLMLTGSVIVDDTPGLAEAVRKLERGGVVERVQMQQKERVSGRRFGLTERHFTTRLKMLAGFVPAEDEVEEWIAHSKGKD